MEVIKVSLIYKFRAPLFLDKGPAPQCEGPPKVPPMGSERPITIATPVAARAWRRLSSRATEELPTLYTPLVTTHPGTRSQEGLLHHVSRHAAYKVGTADAYTGPSLGLWSLVWELSVFCF